MYLHMGRNGGNGDDGMATCSSCNEHRPYFGDWKNDNNYL